MSLERVKLPAADDLDDGEHGRPAAGVHRPDPYRRRLLPLGLRRVHDDALVLHLMYWPDEIRDPTELLPPPVEVTEDESGSRYGTWSSL
ncbi:hypothetical protein ABT270_02085 [Streptomyces sp900105245]|uniref:hypothetical protein n=1 Tax=Streptomyces sp. 900105245 TaxID=3154379 RepID=UPI0033315E57